MFDENSEKTEEKFDFDSAGEALGYLSLEQSRVLAMEQARDNTDFYVWAIRSYIQPTISGRPIHHGQYVHGRTPGPAGGNERNLRRGKIDRSVFIGVRPKNTAYFLYANTMAAIEGCVGTVHTN